MAYFLAYFGLVELLVNFRQRLRFLHINMWWQVQQGKLLRSICYYVIGLDLRLFEMVGIREPKNFESNHFALFKRLLQQQTCCHGGYLREIRAFPLTLKPMEPLNLVDTKFQ